MNFIPREIQPLTLTMNDCLLYTKIREQRRKELTSKLPERRGMLDPPTIQEKPKKRMARRPLDKSNK